MPVFIELVVQQSRQDKRDRSRPGRTNECQNKAQVLHHYRYKVVSDRGAGIWCVVFAKPSVKCCTIFKRLWGGYECRLVCQL
ncbi:hypothetical protein AX774_g1658 [Zancudomyces culisetae]|uniref:Uncharacterized protein n=1 Tax=Zancudomyces culisetae TaxID=1213189 RepID=A0A1R1PV17_ZANCU|nr:hypothetical protein AX774_g1658 [Zancudomyces culisetae]|eukprot:OMH84810.1 hypothetical protein AX774_g1658 [Zancudomyces culisetae]